MSKQAPSGGDAPGHRDVPQHEWGLSPAIMDTPKVEVEMESRVNEVKPARKLTFDEPVSKLMSDISPLADTGVNDSADMSESNRESPSESRPEDTPEDRFLNALLDNNLATFEDMLKRKSVKLDYHYRRKPYYGTILEIASSRSCGAPFVKILLQNKVRPNVHNVQPEPIHRAAKKGFSDILHTLLSQRQIKAFAIDSRGRTALHLACTNINPQRKNDYIKCIKMLMGKLELADINRPDINGFTAFHSLLRGNQSKKRWQSTEGSSVEGSEDNLLQLRSKEDDHRAREHAAKVMLQESRGALDVDSCCARGVTARDEVERWYPQLKNLLPRCRDVLRADPHTPLIDAIRDGRIEDFIALLQQTDSEGYPVLDPNYWFEDPLHANCLELACKNANGTQFVQALLDAGADPNVPNKITYDFPIHVTCDMGNYASLKVLLDYQADANCSDKSGNTPLHRVMEKSKGGDDDKCEWLKCFDVLLDVVGLDVNRKNDDEDMPLMIAARYKNMYVIRKALYDEKHPWEFDIMLDGKMMNEALPELFTHENKADDTTQLEKRIRPTIKQRSKLPESSKISSELFGLLYQGKEEEFVRRLHELKQSNLLQSLSIHDGKFTLLQHSAHYQHLKATQALLGEGALPNDIFGGNRSPPLVLAVCSKSMDIAKILLDDPSTRVNDTDDKGYSPLHFASRADNLEMVILLMRHGADLNAVNKFGKPPFDEKHAKILLDQCVNTKKKNFPDENVLTFDYRLLAPGKAVAKNCNDYYSVSINDDKRNDSKKLVNKHVGGEMDFLDMLSRNEKMSDLLHHPVAWSFLQVKWKRVKCLSYINLISYIIFIVSLHSFIVCSKRYPLKKNDIYCSESLEILLPLAFITMLTWGLVFFRELLQYGLDTKDYFYNSENYVDWSVLVSSLLVIILPFTLNFTPTTVAIINYVDVFTIMLSCTELLILLGRLSLFATNIEMLKVVMKSYALPLLSYCVIIIAFGLSFHTLCHEQGYKEEKPKPSNETNKTEANHFHSWYMSIVKSLVMMTGELEFDSFPNTSALSVLVFAVFVLLVTLVLLNLLTGVAVSDTQCIREAAKGLRSQTRVGVVMRIERTLLCLLNGESALARFLLGPRALRLCLTRHLRRALLFADAKEGAPREGCFKPSVDSKVVLSSDDTSVGEDMQLDREAHESVMRILSERSAAAAPCTTVGDVDVKVEVLIGMVRDLRNVMLAAVPGVERRIASSVSSRGEVFSDWDINAPVFSGKD